MAGMGLRKKRRRSCNETDRVVERWDTHPERGQTSAWSFVTRELEKPAWKGKQMRAENACALFHSEVDWNTIDWRTVNRKICTGCKCVS